MSSIRCLLAFLALASATTVSGAAWAQNGVLGIYADRKGESCGAPLASGRTTTLYVVFLPRGSTMSGITGAEFRIDTSSASGYLFQDEQAIDAALYLPAALGSGANVAFAACDRRIAIPLLRFQAYNTGSGAPNARLRVVHKNPPPNLNFPCPLAVTCDFNLVCVDAGEFVLNPSGSITCAGAAADSEWSRVKELYR
jgi:hypothetical protein